MLLGLVIDKNGLVPDADVKRAKEFGDIIRKTFSKPIRKLCMHKAWNGCGRVKLNGIIPSLSLTVTVPLGTYMTVSRISADFPLKRGFLDVFCKNSRHCFP